MLSYLRKKIGIPENRFYIDMEEVGNTSTSSIPIVLNNIFKKDCIMVIFFYVHLEGGILGEGT